MSISPGFSSLLSRLGKQIRARRRELGLTVRELAEKAELSARFLSDLEAGRANIAVGRLARVAHALGTESSILLQPEYTGARAAIDRMLDGRNETEVEQCRRVLETVLDIDQPRAIALLGLRGAGKSTVGPKLAARLGMPFEELDERIERAAGLSLAELFALHGEPYYRRLESRCLLDLLSSVKPSVVALSGGIVHNDSAWRFVLEHTTTVWMRAEPEVHMQRVLAQGDVRPITDRADAMAELRALLRSREPLYQQAQLKVETSARGLDDTLSELIEKLAEAGWS